MNDMDRAIFKIGYGLYVVTCNDGKKDNGLIVNSVVQLTSTPKTVAVAINKQNYSHDVILETKKMNVNILNIDAPFSVFKNFGFQSGRTADKFKDVKSGKAQNGLQVLFENINAFLCLEVQQYVDMGTHGLFICGVTDAGVLNDKETMTYSYYQQNVKPKPQKTEKKGFVCKICGYVHEGDTLPEDFSCPLCKHPASDFEPIA